MSPTFSHVIACPKCGRSRADGAAACPRCGLVFANWTPGSKLDHPAAEMPVPLDAEGLRLWDGLVGHWSDEAGHEAFLKHCATVGRLAAAGRQYRKRLDAYPQDQVAARMQARIVGMVAATLEPARTAAAGPFSRTRWFWWVVMACGVGGAVAGTIHHPLGR